MTPTYPVAVLETNGDYRICSSVGEICREVEPYDVGDVVLIDQNGKAYRISIVPPSSDQERVAQHLGTPGRYVFHEVEFQSDEALHQRIFAELKERGAK